MNLSEIDLFALAEKRLAWTDRRQTLLAENIANADTPGWAPREAVSFASLLSGATQAMRPAQTAPGHLAGIAPEVITAAQQKAEHAPDGNGVRLDVELSKVADTGAIHDLTTNLYMKYLGFFRTAMGR